MIRASMLIGAHVSMAGGVWHAPQNAAALGLETFQIFTRSPRGGAAPQIGPEEIKKFKEAMHQHGFNDFVIHAPYYTNLGSTSKKIYHGTIAVLREELERGTSLGASYVMFHPGTFKESGQEAGMKQVIEGIGQTLAGYKGDTKLLIEISAGAGDICGDTFEELAAMLEGNKKYLEKSLAGICFDTQHAFASGYDLRTPEAVQRTMTEFDEKIGLKYLKLIHSNDSRVDLAERRDRHEHIGKGKIGKQGFAALAEFFKNNKLDLSWILETKGDKVAEDAQVLKKIKTNLYGR